MSDVAEVCSFLDDARPDVREMAAEGVAGYTADALGCAALLKVPTLYQLLVPLLERAARPDASAEAVAAAHAAAALVNLSQQPAERVKLIGAGAVSAAAACARVTSPPELAEYACMLLTNLTALPGGRAELLKATVAGEPAAVGLLRELGATALDAESRSHLPNVLSNASQEALGRSQLLAALASDAALGKACCAHLACADETRRLGLARSLRHLSFAAGGRGIDRHGRRYGGGTEGGGGEGGEGGAAAAGGGAAGGAAPAGGREEVEGSRSQLLSDALLPTLVAAMAGRLGPSGARYTDEDRVGFSAELTAALGLEARTAESAEGGGKAEAAAAPKPAPEDEKGGGLATSMTSEEEEEAEHKGVPVESNAEVRLALTEGLLLLSASADGCEAMKAIGIYPVCREAHLCEEERGVKEANEQLVEEFYLRGVEPPAEMAEGAEAAAAGVAAMGVGGGGGESAQVEEDEEEGRIEEVVD